MSARWPVSYGPAGNLRGAQKSLPLGKLMWSFPVRMPTRDDFLEQFCFASDSLYQLFSWRQRHVQDAKVTPLCSCVIYLRWWSSLRARGPLVSWWCKHAHGQWPCADCPAPCLANSGRRQKTRPATLSWLLVQLIQLQWTEASLLLHCHFLPPHSLLCISYHPQVPYPLAPPPSPSPGHLCFFLPGCNFTQSHRGWGTTGVAVGLILGPVESIL